MHTRCNPLHPAAQVRAGVGHEREAPAAKGGQGPRAAGRGHRADRQARVEGGSGGAQAHAYIHTGLNSGAPGAQRRVEQAPGGASGGRRLRGHGRGRASAALAGAGSCNICCLTPRRCARLVLAVGGQQAKQRRCAQQLQSALLAALLAALIAALIACRRLHVVSLFCLSLAARPFKAAPGPPRHQKTINHSQLPHRPSNTPALSPQTVCEAGSRAAVCAAGGHAGVSRRRSAAFSLSTVAAPCLLRSFDRPHKSYQCPLAPCGLQTSWKARVASSDLSAPAASSPRPEGSNSSTAMRLVRSCAARGDGCCGAPRRAPAPALLLLALLAAATASSSASPGPSLEAQLLAEAYSPDVQDYIISTRRRAVAG